MHQAQELFFIKISINDFNECAADILLAALDISTESRSPDQQQTAFLEPRFELVEIMADGTIRHAQHACQCEELDGLRRLQELPGQDDLPLLRRISRKLRMHDVLSHLFQAADITVQTESRSCLADELQPVGFEHHLHFGEFPRNRLAADAEFLGNRASCHRLATFQQALDNGDGASTCLHVSASYVHSEAFWIPST